MEPFAKALEVVARVMRDGAATHPDNDGILRSPEWAAPKSICASGVTAISCRTMCPTRRRAS